MIHTESNQLKPYIIFQPFNSGIFVAGCGQIPQEGRLGQVISDALLRPWTVSREEPGILM